MFLDISFIENWLHMIQTQNYVLTNQFFFSIDYEKFLQE
jgi:hypothetical protein